MPGRFDVVVVGAGPAGASAAYVLARRGLRVLVVERGRGAGSKQVFGGRVYAEPLRRVFGSLGDAPIHRWVARERLSVVSGGRMLTVEYASPTRYSFTAYLTQLASWMMGKASEAGAVLVDEVRVDSLLLEEGRVAGIVSGGDVVRADVVVDAEGANRMLLERLGLVGKPRPGEMALGVKEVVKVGAEAIEERLGLGSDEGLAWIIAGDVTGYAPGGAFIYTNKDTVSIGVVMPLSFYEALGKEPYRLAEELRLHPLLGRLWRGGDVLEYSAHLVPEAGVRLVPRKLALDGLVVVGDAAGLLLNTGYTIRGVDYAVYSGALAAEAIVEAHEKGLGYGERVLRRLYEERLRRSPVMRDMMRHRLMEELLREPRMLKRYSGLLTAAAKNLYELGVETPTLVEALRRAGEEQGASMLRLLWDAFRVVRRI